MPTKLHWFLLVGTGATLWFVNQSYLAPETEKVSVSIKTVQPESPGRIFDSSAITPAGDNPPAGVIPQTDGPVADTSSLDIPDIASADDELFIDYQNNRIVIQSDQEEDSAYEVAVDPEILVYQQQSNFQAIESIPDTLGEPGQDFGEPPPIQVEEQNLAIDGTNTPDLLVVTEGEHIEYFPIEQGPLAPPIETEIEETISSETLSE